MISGVYYPGQGAYLTGRLYLPPPVDAYLDISFLVDTGAQRTILMPVDVLRAPDLLSRLAVSPSPIPLKGIGGVMQPLRTAVGLGFAHDDGTTTGFAFNILLSADQSLVGMPSLLGLDILSHGNLRLDAESRLVLWDVPTTIFDMMVST